MWQRLSNCSAMPSSRARHVARQALSQLGRGTDQNARGRDDHGLGRLAPFAAHGLDLPHEVHALDDLAEDHMLAVEPAERETDRQTDILSRHPYLDGALGAEHRSLGDSGRSLAAKSYRSRPLGRTAASPWALGGAARSLESPPQEARAVGCGAAKTAPCVDMRTEPRRLDGGDEELAAVGVRAGVGH